MKLLIFASKFSLSVLFLFFYSIIGAQGVKLGIQGILKKSGLLVRTILSE